MFKRNGRGGGSIRLSKKYGLNSTIPLKREDALKRWVKHEAVLRFALQKRGLLIGRAPAESLMSE